MWILPGKIREGALQGFPEPPPKQAMSYPQHVQFPLGEALPAFLLSTRESRQGRKGDLLPPEHGNAPSRRLDEDGTQGHHPLLPLTPPPPLQLKGLCLYTAHRPGPEYALGILPQHSLSRALLVFLPGNRCQMGSLAKPQTQQRGSRWKWGRHLPVLR